MKIIQYFLKEEPVLERVCVCARARACAHTNSFLSVMKSSAEDIELKHWLVVMKKSAPILKHTNYC